MILRYCILIFLFIGISLILEKRDVADPEGGVSSETSDHSHQIASRTLDVQDSEERKESQEPRLDENGQSSELRIVSPLDANSFFGSTLAQIRAAMEISEALRYDPHRRIERDYKRQHWKRTTVSGRAFGADIEDTIINSRHSVTFSLDQFEFECSWISREDDFPVSMNTFATFKDVNGDVIDRFHSKVVLRDDVAMVHHLTWGPVGLGEGYFELHSRTDLDLIEIRSLFAEHRPDQRFRELYVDGHLQAK